MSPSSRWGDSAFVTAGLTAFAASRRGPHDRLPIEPDLHRAPAVILTPSWRNHGVLGTGFVPVELAASSLKLQPKEYKLDSFVRSLRPGTALVLKANLETPSQWIMVDGLEGRSEGRLKVEETQPTANRYFLKAIKWNWVD